MVVVAVILHVIDNHTSPLHMISSANLFEIGHVKCFPVRRRLRESCTFSGRFCHGRENTYMFPSLRSGHVRKCPSWEKPWYF